MPRFIAVTLISNSLLIYLTACGSVIEPPVFQPCAPSTQGIILLPTTEPDADPDLNGENPRDYVYAADCLTMAEATPAPVETAVLTGAVQNVTLDSHDAQIEAVAASAHMTAVAWTQDGGVYVGISRGKGGFEIARVDDGTNPDLAISGVDRLHLVYQQNLSINYRVADGNDHPADSDIVFSTLGSDPEVEVDLSNWSHIVYMTHNGLGHIVHMGDGNWFPVPMPSANTFNLTSTGESLQLLLTTDNQVQVHSMYFFSPPIYSWGLEAAWPIEGELQGPPHLAYNKPVGVLDYYDYHGDEPYWMAVSWVERFEDTAPPEIDTLIPTYEIVNPLYPDQLANPDQIAEGMNAVRWHGDHDPYDAGLMQKISVGSSPLIIQARVKALSSENANAQLRIGIDPSGGSNPFSASVIWSNPLTNPGAFTVISIETAVSGSSATLFLRSTQDAAEATAVAIWDQIEVTSGDAVVQNAGFEGAFETEGVVSNVPAGWDAFFDDTYTSEIDSGAAVRDVYRVYAAWSENRGLDWSHKQTITENRELAAGITGALRPAVYPAITTLTEPDTLAFVYIHESGDPPANTTFLRYGRPTIVRCEAGTTSCTDSPGDPIFPRDLIRPTINLVAVQDHASNGQVVLVWDTLQTDYESKDIHMTVLSLTD